MKVNGGKALTGVLLIAAGSALSQGASAQEATVAVSPTGGDVWGQAWAEHGGVRTWGDVEAGFRAFIDRPPNAALPGIMPSGVPTAAGTNVNPLTGGQPAPIFNTDRNNRAKFEEYGNVNPGLYLERLILGAQTKDGDYAAELRADDVGNNNQRFIFDWSKAGEHYGTFSWDQIPHLYSTSALSIWNGVGTNFLTTPVSDPHGRRDRRPPCGQRPCRQPGRLQCPAGASQSHRDRHPARQVLGDGALDARPELGFPGRLFARAARGHPGRRRGDRRHGSAADGAAAGAGGRHHAERQDVWPVFRRHAVGWKVQHSHLGECLKL